MRHQWIGLALSLAVAAAASGQTAAPAAHAEGTAATQAATGPSVQVPVKRIVLFSSGVGFFEHQGQVSGNASTELMFKTEQINDILKSLVLSDRGGGAIRTVTYPSQDPLSKTLKSFQIDISANPPLADLLNQIRGTKVLVVLGDEQIDGTVLGVQKKQRPVGKEGDKTEEVWQLNLLTGAGIRTVMLEDAKRIDIQDATLQKELAQALQALAQARDKDKKPVIIRFEGQGDRPVSIGYVVETPIWKTSYRLMLPEISSQDNARLQGWAIVENQTENDWNNVDLALVGGRPISFIENLYQPLYIPRPVTQPKTYASLRPQTYDEGIESLATDRLAAQDRPAAPAARMEAASRRIAAGGRGGFGGDVNQEMAMAAKVAAPVDYSQGVASIAQAAKIGELFQYNVENVTLARQRSAMLPIVTDGVAFDRLSIYNAAVLPRNPLLGVRLKNTTSKYLLGGPITVMHTEKDRGTVYAGDAKIDDVPVGQERLLSYGVDQEMLVDATTQRQDDNIVTGSIVKGVLRVSYRTENTHQFTIENKADREKSLIIEEPVQQPFELVEPAKPLEKTDTLYRFQVKVGPKKSGTFNVRKQWVRLEEYAILPMDIGQIDFYGKNGAIPEKVKKVLQTAIEKKQAMVDVQRSIATAEKNRKQVLEEEENIRKNINTLPSSSKIYQDQIKDMTDKEAELKQLNQSLKDLQAKLENARADLEKYLNEMTVD